MKAEQARAYEAMKGQFEGLLGRLQVCTCSGGGVMEKSRRKGRVEGLFPRLLHMRVSNS